MATNGTNATNAAAAAAGLARARVRRGLVVGGRRLRGRLRLHRAEDARQRRRRPGGRPGPTGQAWAPWGQWLDCLCDSADSVGSKGRQCSQAWGGSRPSLRPGVFNLTHPGYGASHFLIPSSRTQPVINCEQLTKHFGTSTNWDQYEPDTVSTEIV